MEGDVEERSTEAILEVLAGVLEPLGARQIRQVLRGDDLDISEATVARRLRALDRRGLTVSVGAKGRMLTATGRHHVASVLRGRVTATRFAQGTEIRTTEGLIQLLRARRAVEPEAARDAAEAADDSAGEALSMLVDEHRQHYLVADDVPRDISLRFHRRVARCSRNPIVKPMLDVVLDPALDRLEAALDVVLASHRSGELAVAEHQLIADAIAAGDAVAAEESMRTHLDRLLDEARRFLTEETAPIVERLLTWGMPVATKGAPDVVH
ncbi:FCD domain-containing protein [Saccharopolyspora sp. K220]|uniref:FCD domain-containing protein n=1 Tax=Saccharopolyspora soli TaxID=2926618 RepID=UPI001F59386F|nr:FCD domain-containing protein [Saccharopolyspora soli]MCI2421667.1 FCD domain-containing protein [Saccharopolyspora soli]